MKKSNVIIAICLILVCVIGWFAVGSQVIKNSSNYSNYIKEADDWVERGLYQRAIGNYQLALKEKESADLYEIINNAYQLRFKEAPEETLEDYMDFLESAIAAYPGNKVLVDSFYDIFYSESEYEDLYNCLTNAIKNGYKTEEIQAKLLIVKYAYDLRRSEFAGIKQSVGDIYSTARNNGWNIYSIEDGYMLTTEYDYVSQVSKDGIFVVTGKDSRIMDKTGMVLGIFEKKVTDAGLYADKLLPACVDGKYSFYNDLAEEQFGGYEMAGTFQDGLAAVKKDGKWMLIDTKSEIKSQTFDEIVLDHTGRYIIDGYMIAKSGDKYGLYDEKLKLKAELDCTDVDVCTEDGVIAVCKGEKWGFVNTAGKVVIEPSFDNAKSFSNGLAAVMKDGKWGFINSDGTVVIDYEYAATGYMNENGLCPVRIILPEDKAEKKDEDKTEEIKVEEVWKLLELELGITED